MPCLIRLTSLTNLEGSPLRSNLKLILHILDWIPSHFRLPRLGILYPPIWKRHLLFSILSNVYWNGLALFANVVAVFYATPTMFDSYILMDAFYWLLMNSHVFSTCVFYMFRLIFTCIILIDHSSFSRLIASGLCYLFVVCATQNKLYLILSYLNSLRPRGTYVRQQTRPPLVQIIVLRLFVAKPSFEAILEYF